MEYMQKWQGLYSAAFLLALQPAAFHERLYAITSVIIMMILTIGIITLMNSIIHNGLRVKSKEGYFIGFIISFYMIQCMPDRVEGLFWYNGAMNYLFFFGLVLIHISLLIRYWNKDKAYFSILLSTLLCFLISGGNHVTSFACILINICFLFFALIKKKKYMVLLPAISGIIGFIIMCTAPGTAIRAAKDGADVSLLKTIFSCGYQTLISDKSFISVSIILLLAVLTPYFAQMIKMSQVDIFNIWGMIGCLVFDFTLISAMYCVPYYAMGVFGEGRVLDTIYCAYIVLLLLTYWYFVGFVLKYMPGIVSEADKINSNSMKYAIYSIVCILFIGYISITGGVNKYSTGAEAVMEIADGSAKRYDAEYMERVELYEDALIDNVVVDEYTAKPELLFFADMNEEPEKWPNTIIARYYNKNGIGMRKK